MTQPTVDTQVAKEMQGLSVSDPKGRSDTADDAQQGETTPLMSWLPSLPLPSLPDLLPLQLLLPLGKPLAESDTPGNVPISPPRRPPSPIREESQATIRPLRAVQATPYESEPSGTTSPGRSSTSTAYDVPVGEEPATASKQSRFRAFRSKRRPNSVFSTESTLSRVSTRVSELGRKDTGPTVKVGSKGLKSDQRWLPSKLECLQQLTPPSFAVGPARKDSADSMASNAILAMRPSLCGRWLASAGRNQVVYIWELVQNIYDPWPTRAFIGHEGEILDLAWSKGGFLLSCGMDKVVRIWHPEKEECLGEFEVS
jgi:WD40 repeat protein